MHNLKPNTEYVIVSIQVAVTREDYESGVYADGINCMMDCGMFELDGSSGVVGDWTFPADHEPIPGKPGLHQLKVDGTFTTGDKVWEGQTFGCPYEASNTAVQDEEAARSL
jgi:hypothetical protein